MIFKIVIISLVVKGFVFPQSLYIIEATQENVFEPNAVNIMTGDTVRWINSGGNHNVIADDSSFTSGSPNSTSWTFEYVFTSTGDFNYYCEIHGAPGLTGMSGVVRVQQTTGTDEQNVSYGFELKQNYPNPFNPETIITYSIGTNTFVSLDVYDILGNEVASLVKEVQSPGQHTVRFTSNGLSSGKYFYKISAGSYTSTKSFILLK